MACQRWTTYSAANRRLMLCVGYLGSTAEARRRFSLQSEEQTDTESRQNVSCFGMVVLQHSHNVLPELKLLQVCQTDCSEMAVEQRDPHQNASCGGASWLGARVLCPVDNLTITSTGQRHPDASQHHRGTHPRAFRGRRGAPPSICRETMRGGYCSALSYREITKLERVKGWSYRHSACQPSGGSTFPALSPSVLLDLSDWLACLLHAQTFNLHAL
jgi:hypothetical protein